MSSKYLLYKNNLNKWISRRIFKNLRKEELKVDQ